MVPRHALVLTAGIGSRLRPLTLVRAKPAIPVAGEPIVRRIIRWLTSHGIREIVLNLHHLPATLTAVVGDGSDLDARVRYSWEQPTVLGSAGGPRLALPLIDDARFLLINGDTLTDVDPEAVSATHSRSGAAVTLALVPNTEPHRYGGVSLDESGRVIGFPRRGPAAEGSYHFIGVQVVESAVFEPLPADRPVSTIGGVYDDLIRQHRGTIVGHVCDARFWDVGTTADYLATSLDFARAEGRPDVAVGARVRIDPTARMARSIVWDDVSIGPGCELTRCIVSDHVTLASGSRFENMVITDVNGVAVPTPLMA